MIGRRMRHGILLVGLGAACAAWLEGRSLRADDSQDVQPPRLVDASKFQQDPQVKWFDDYYTIQYIDDQTIAIGEPRYHQMNYNYLIVGKERAILFDTGPGVRDIRPVVRSLTSLPVTVTCSHLHYDHVGNHPAFERIALIDLPELHQRVDGEGRFTPTKDEHLGDYEGIERKSFTVTHWWKPRATIDLGGRELEVLHTPGHTKSSMMLLDRSRKLLFTGDFIYPGELFAMVPGSDLSDYLRTTKQLLSAVDRKTRLLTPHRSFSPSVQAPIIDVQFLIDLKATLTAISEGKAKKGTIVDLGSFGRYRAFKVNDKMSLLTNLPADKRP